ncbi:Xenotropic and polytropic retrovirus receptor 1-like, partial [Paramuricea clavata]
SLTEGSSLISSWKVDRIINEKMKEILYDALEEMRSDEEADPAIKEQYFAQFEERFFMFCDKELEKVNTFFAEKIAEAQRKFTTLKNEAECGGYLSAKSSLNQIRRGAVSGQILDPNVKKLLAKTHRKAKNLKLAFSEFYLSLVLLQNFQQLNFTGFRKILKKHDKLFETQNGLNFKKKVQKSPFFINKGVDTLISETENIFINELEEGDRSKAMNRLRVPPLTEREKRSWVIFRCGFFLGMFLVLLVIVIIGLEVKGYGNEWLPILRMYRGVFLLVMILFLVAINTCGWRAAGVNHVLIFELNPRTHLTYQQVLEASACLSVIWCLSFIAYIYHDDIGIYPFTPPLIMAIIMIVFTFNPFKCGFHGARWWLLKIVYRVITAPFHAVGFADFWLADQMNSLNTMFLDTEYSLCYLVYGWYSSGVFMFARRKSKVDWKSVDDRDGLDHCPWLQSSCGGGQISYVASISDLLDFRKFSRPPASVLENFAVTEVYVKRARKCLAKGMRSNWTTDLDIETLESRRSWATLSEVQSVIPFHVERYESVLENSAYMFLKKIFKTAKKPLLTPTCESFQRAGVRSHRKLRT